jgi:ribonuclease HI
MGSTAVMVGAAAGLRLLLGPSPEEIVIYGDGSFSCDLLAGAWAAYVPSFGLQIVGSGFGPSAGHFEFCALAEGIRAVVRIDHTTRPLHLRTDSEHVAGVLRLLSARVDLPARKSFDGMRSLYVRARQLLGTRSVHWSRADTQSAFHRICHQAARHALRKQVQHHLALDAVMALRYEQRRREDLLRHREQLVHRMNRIENRLRLCDARIAQCATNINRQQGDRHE